MNTVGSLLVHMDASPRAEVRLALAQHVAAKCASGPQASGVIEAVYCSTPSLADVPPALGKGMGAAMPFLQDLYDQRYDAAHRTFERLKAAAPVRMRWLELVGQPVATAVARRALYADLLFLGQHRSDDPEGLGMPSGFVESVLIDSGRPAIVVPYAGSFTTLGDRVLIAWSPTRESARALSAALPLLQRASVIHLAIASGCDEFRMDLEAQLRAHGVAAKCVSHAGVRAEAAGEHLLSLAADAGADLLVMGCYGHSRARELLLGGVTRTLLESMTLPVLMAH